MISIPIFGGENLQRASANEKQGQAFAVLPCALPKDTPVRVTLWLDGSGIFRVSAYLEEGTSPDRGTVSGDADALAIEAIERVERRIASEAPSGDVARTLEDGRDRVMGQMKARDFEGALREVAALEKEAEGATRGGVAIRDRAERSLGFLELVLHQYGWCFERSHLHQLGRLVADVRRHLEQGSDDDALEQQLAQVERLVDNLPEGAQMLLGLRAIIGARIHPVDPAAAAALIEEVDAFEE